MLPSIVVVSLTFLGVLKLLLLEVLLLMLSLWLMLFLIRAKIGVEGPMYVLTWLNDHDQGVPSFRGC